MKIKTVAIICSYPLDPNRVGGMDRFFWQFDQKCKKNNIETVWFFSNNASHGNYPELKKISSEGLPLESFFINYINENHIKFDFVVTHFIELCTSFFKKIKNHHPSRIICIDHNPRPVNGYSIKKKIIKRIKGILYSKHINVFVGVSQYTSNQILNDFGDHLKNKTYTIYNGVFIDDILKREQRNFCNPTFLTASHLRESKGIQDLIDAVAQLPDDTKSKIVIDIYGDGPYKSVLLEKVNVKNVVPNFNFKGSKSNLKDIFHQYDYMLQPTHMECFSLSILESLAANVPVITTNVGGNEEVITDFENGFIFPANNTLALKNILQDLLSANKKILIDTRILIENNFSLDKMVENHFQLLS